MKWLMRLLFRPSVLLIEDGGVLELARSFSVGRRCFVQTRRGYLVELLDDGKTRGCDYLPRWEALK